MVVGGSSRSGGTSDQRSPSGPHFARSAITSAASGSPASSYQASAWAGGPDRVGIPTRGMGRPGFSGGKAREDFEDHGPSRPPGLGGGSGRVGSNHVIT